MRVEFPSNHASGRVTPTPLKKTSTVPVQNKDFAVCGAKRNLIRSRAARPQVCGRRCETVLPTSPSWFTLQSIWSGFQQRLRPLVPGECAGVCSTFVQDVFWVRAAAAITSNKVLAGTNAAPAGAVSMRQMGGRSPGQLQLRAAALNLRDFTPVTACLV